MTRKMRITIEIDLDRDEAILTTYTSNGTPLITNLHNVMCQITPTLTECSGSPRRPMVGQAKGSFELRGDFR